MVIYKDNLTVLTVVVTPTRARLRAPAPAYRPGLI